MAISDKIQSIETHLTEAYNTIAQKGGTIPENKNVQNLSTAINSIEGGGEKPPYEVEELFFKQTVSAQSSSVEINSTSSTGFVKKLIISRYLGNSCNLYITEV